MKSTALDKHSLAEFAACEKVIRTGLATFREVGAALATIRDKKLYRADHDTFADYCRDVWGWSINYANRLVAAVKAENVPTGHKNPAPVIERHARELNRLPAPQRSEVLKTVQQSGEKVTAKRLKEAVDEKLGVAGKVLDALERPVKVGLEPIFRARKDFFAARMACVEVRNQLRSLASGPAGRVIRSHIQAMERDLRNVSEAVKYANPHAECPACNGLKPVCLVCGDPTTGADPRGWVTELEWKANRKGKR